MIRKIVEIDPERCDGCGLCVPSCAEGAIRIENGKARLAADNLCDGLGACLGECPRDAIRIVEREAGKFDHEAVEQARHEEARVQREAPPRACPGSLLVPRGPGQWPVKLALVPPTASWLRGAHLLLVADCAPFACRDFHSRFAAGKAMAAACPKFESSEAQVRRLAEILAGGGVREITLVRMEVPCCGGLGRNLQQAMREAGVVVPVAEVVLDVGGEVMAEKARS